MPPQGLLHCRLDQRRDAAGVQVHVASRKVEIVVEVADIDGDHEVALPQHRLNLWRSEQHVEGPAVRTPVGAEVDQNLAMARSRLRDGHLNVRLRIASGVISIWEG